MFQSRSTKGASKQRRDWINTEINEIKEYLPVSESVRRRLSQLQVMALCNAYIAKTNCFRNAVSYQDDNGSLSNFDFPEALPGFLLAINLEGKLLHISENVTEYLGHSMVDLMTQADTVYDIIDDMDHAVLREFLMSGRTKCDARPSSLDELNFACRMSLGRLFRRNNAFDRQKIMKMRGRLIWPEGCLNLSEPVFVACCSPMLSCSTAEQATALDTMTFQTCHSPNMKFNDIDLKGEFHLGHSREDLYQTSWYQLIHPEDVPLAARKHTEMIRGGAENAQSLCVRMQTKYGHFAWVHVVMRLNGGVPFGPLGGVDSAPQEILCLNQVINEMEAMEIKNCESWEEMLERNRSGGRVGGSPFEPVQLREESYLPTIVLEEGFLDQVTSEEFAPPLVPVAECNHQELMRKLRCKAQQKRQAKKARIDKGISTSFDSFDSASRGRGGIAANGNVQQYASDAAPNVNFAAATSQMAQFTASSQQSLAIDSVASPECYVVRGPMTPAYSDDGYGTDCTAAHYTAASTPDNSTAASCTPPYSPPSNFCYLDEAPSHSSLEDSSFFDGGVHATALKPGVVPVNVEAVQSLQQKFIMDDLPELDQCILDSILSGDESRQKPFIPQYSSLGASNRCSANQWVFQAAPGAFSLADETRFPSMNEGRFGTTSEMRDLGALQADASFMDMFNGSLFFETVDLLSTAEQLQLS